MGKRFNDEKILEDANSLEIADSIGIKMKKRGISYFIECQEHYARTGKSDSKWDKCTINKEGEKAYYCFSCGAGGNIIQLVSKYLGIDGYHARKTICEIIGSPDMYLEDSDYDPDTVMPYSKRQLEALGLVPSIRAILPENLFQEEEEIKKRGLILMPQTQAVPYWMEQNHIIFGKQEENSFVRPAYVGCKKEIMTLNTLFQEAPDEFHAMVFGKSSEMYEKYITMLDMDLAGTLLNEEIAYFVNSAYRNWMGICKRIHDDYLKSGYGKDFMRQVAG